MIEAAQACGLTLLPRDALAPLTATSRGVGELILAACRAGAKRIVLGVGGVASTDGGAGLVQALGARLTDESGRELPPGGAALARLAGLDLARLADLTGVEFLLASDVDNPLLGPYGAAAVYGPQKGAAPRDVPLLEAGLRRWRGYRGSGGGRCAGAGRLGGRGRSGWFGRARQLAGQGRPRRGRGRRARVRRACSSSAPGCGRGSSCCLSSPRSDPCLTGPGW